MKRTIFALSLLAFLMVASSSLQAQGGQVALGAKPVYSGMPVVSAYVNSFENAVNEGNIQMAQAHRTKLVAFIERDIQNVTAANAAKNVTQPDEMSQEKAIIAELKALNLNDAAALGIAKTKFATLEGYEKAYLKRTAATN